MSSPAVKQAQRVIQRLSDLNQEVKDNIQTSQLEVRGDSRKSSPPNQPSPEQKYRIVSEKLRQEAEIDMERRRHAWMQPAPLDEYLKRNQEVLLDPHYPAALPMPGSHLVGSPSQRNAPVLPPSCAHAQEMLEKARRAREALEVNLETVARRREDEDFYQLLQGICKDGDASHLTRIKYAVDEQISAIDAEIKRELHQKKISGRHSPPTRLLPDKPPKASQQQQQHQQQSNRQHPQLRQQNKTTQPSTRPGQPTNTTLGRVGKKRVQAKIDTGLGRRRREEQEEVRGRGADLEQNKENLREVRSPAKGSTRAGMKAPRDDRYVYGSTRFQAHRSTLRDAPYLHFTNQTPTKGKKLPAHHSGLAPSPDYKAARTQTKHPSGHRSTMHPTPANQYYFNPYPAGGPAIPRAAAAQTYPHHPAAYPAPAHGQLVPMAIPLREPRMGVGLAQPVTISSGGGDPIHADEGKETPNQQEKTRSRQEKANVAVIDVVVEEDNKPELTIQRLPNVDIDTAPPTPASSADAIPPRVELPEAEATDACNDEPSEEEDDVPGISMRGAMAPRQTPYHGPAFPPQQPPPRLPDTTTTLPSSDQLAAGIRRREMLQNRAVDWVEQELIARLVSETYRRMPERPPAQPSYQDRSSSSSDESNGIVDALGGGGLQLFVDAGQPVDPALVNSLVQEVLEEKIALCVGQHEREPSPERALSPHDARQPTPRPVRQGSPIPTPEPTPPSSPIPLPSREPSPTPRDRIPTPDVSEMGEGASGGAESETESLKDLMQDPETSREEAVTIPAPGLAPVTTPPTTPPPISAASPPPIHRGAPPHTPQPSPRASPVPLPAPNQPMDTPTPTPEPRSPVASEPEADIFQETLPSPSPEPRLSSPTPPPPPSPPKPATPAPPSVESSSSTTETTPPESSTTVSTGRTLSEGEWLISEKEEGRVPDETLFGVPDMDVFDESSQSSAASTIKGPLDPDKDRDELRSEGEVHPAQLRLTRDPVVAILSRLRQPPSNLPLSTNMPGLQPSAASSPQSSTSSTGEVSDGQRPSLMQPTERLMYREVKRTKPPGLDRDHRKSIGEVRSNGEEEDEDRAEAAAFIPTRDLVRDDAARDDSVRDSGAPHVRMVTPMKDGAAPQIRMVTPMKEGGAASPSIRMVAPAPVVPSPVPRVIQVGRSYGDPEEEEEEEEDGGELETGELSEADMTAGSEAGILRDRPLPASLYSTMASDMGTRDMTPDAMNMDAFLQSGYLSQTFSQSEGGGGATSDMEGSRFLGQTGNSTYGFNASGAIPRGSSHLATSGMFSEDSLEVGARRGEERTFQRSFQVTLPSIASPDEREEEEEGSLSEGELHGGETISDVSEMTL